MPKTEERVDKWLWEMRVFKTRTQATDACKNNRVIIGSAQAKPSRTVKPGDEVSVRKSPITYTFRVKGIPGGRLGARLVPEYLENITPADQYELLEMTRISGFVDRRKGLGRPTKRDARDMASFKESTYTADTYFLDWDDDPDED